MLISQSKIKILIKLPCFKSHKVNLNDKFYFNMGNCIKSEEEEVVLNEQHFQEIADQADMHNVLIQKMKRKNKDS